MTYTTQTWWLSSRWRRRYGLDGIIDFRFVIDQTTSALEGRLHEIVVIAVGIVDIDFVVVVVVVQRKRDAFALTSWRRARRRSLSFRRRRARLLSGSLLGPD